MPIEAPLTLIIYGALRSGTTLLRLMLDGHPGISCPGEADFLVDYISEEHKEFKIDFKELEENRIFKASGLKLRRDVSASEAIKDMARQMQGNSDNVLAIMLHRNLRKALQVFPDALVLHVLRDPRDVAYSSIGMGLAGNTYYGVDHWIRTEDEWDLAIKEGRPFTYDVLKYEDLIARPRQELERVCHFIGLRYDEGMLSYPQYSTYAFPDLSLIEQWKTKQNEQDICLVEGKVGDRLTSRGYRKSGPSQGDPNQAQKLKLLFQNKKIVWARKFKKFGIYDPLIVGIARRLGKPELARHAQRRIDATIIKHLK